VHVVNASGSAPPHDATITFHPDFVVGSVDPRLFGSFVEHLGRGIYTGIYEPAHATADAAGFRSDVGDLISELGVTLVRYPGGNFVSGYQWEDGVGPKTARPRRVDRAWRSIESNQVGTDEFLGWCSRRGTQPMMAVNLGSRGPQSAADLVEYTNVRSGTYWSDLRRTNGAADPYAVKLWCLGNELDGPWQIGQKSAAKYATVAVEAAKAMRAVDPDIELVACGSSSREMPTFGAWESTVLERAYDLVDYVSLHAYYEQHDDDRASFLASGAALDGFISDVVATADAVKARLRSKKALNLSLDEWNVWYMSRFTESRSELLEAPELLEDVYSTLDAVVVGDLLISILKHADRVRIGCLAQLVNVIAPIRTKPGGDAWRQTTFYPFACTAARRGSHVLHATVSAPLSQTARHGEVSDVNAAVTASQSGDDRIDLAIFIVNRAPNPLVVTLNHRSFNELRVVDTASIAADNAGPRHTAAEAAAAQPRPIASHVTSDGATVVQLPAESWTAVRAFANGRLG
jgi:alpha-L-arabinofuranosidase